MNGGPAAARSATLASRPAAPPPAPFDTVRFLDMTVALADAPAVDAALAAASAGPFRYVVTPNVAHVTTLYPAADNQRARDFRAAYADAWLVVCDSRILRLLARAGGLDLPLVTGSDLTARLFTTRFGAGTRVAIIGGEPDLLDQVRARFPGPAYVQHCPPMGMLANLPALHAAADFVAAADCDYVLFACGAPQSEILAHRIWRRSDARGVGLAIGASIEFLTGTRRRAPRWMQRLGLEWMFRLLSEPGRMWRRYLVEGPRIGLLWWRWRRGRALIS